MNQNYLKARKELPPIVCDKEGIEEKTGEVFKYPSLQNVLKAITPVLYANNLILNEKVTAEGIWVHIYDCEKQVKVTEESHFPLPILNSMESSQAKASALTMARRYAILTCLSLSPVDSDDSGAAEVKAIPQAVPGKTKYQKRQEQFPAASSPVTAEVKTTENVPEFPPVEPETKPTLKQIEATLGRPKYARGAKVDISNNAEPDIKAYVAACDFLNVYRKAESLNKFHLCKDETFKQLEGIKAKAEQVTPENSSTVGKVEVANYNSAKKFIQEKILGS